MKMFYRLCAALAMCGLPIYSQDWPQWGGNTLGRNMYSAAKGLPDRVEAGKIKSGTEAIDMATTKNVRWVAKLGSQSYGNTTVAGGKVFVGTNNDSPRDAQHQSDRSILMVFNEKTGDFLWQLVIPKLASGKVNDWENLGLLSSPAVEGDRVYIVTSRCEVMCLDVNGMANGNDGKLEISSNQERLRVPAAEESPNFKWLPNVWYTMKARVDVAADGSGVVRGKAWKRGEPEPDQWTLEVPHKKAHQNGSPGLFGFSPQDMRVYIDNVSVTPN